MNFVQKGIYISAELATSESSACIFVFLLLYNLDYRRVGRRLAGWNPNLALVAAILGPLGYLLLITRKIPVRCNG